MPGKPCLEFAIDEVYPNRYRTELAPGHGGSGVVDKAARGFTEARVAPRVLHEPERPSPLATDADELHRHESPDWLHGLRVSEYGGLTSLEAQAIVGAARFGCTEERGAAEEVLAMVLARDPDPSTVVLTQDLCITIVLGTPAQREQLRSHLPAWAYAPLLPVRQAARDTLREIVTRATRVAPDAFGDDALRPSRIAFGAAHMVSYEARDHEALHALYTLPSGSLEDNRLAHFGLLLMTRLDRAAREQARAAIKSLSQPGEAQRDSARQQLGRLLSRCLRPDETDVTSPVPARLHRAAPHRASPPSAEAGRGSFGGNWWRTPRALRATRTRSSVRCPRP